MAADLLQSDGTLRPMLRLALPVLAEQFLHVLVAFVDTWLAGHYLQGPSYLAAIGLMAYVLWLMASMFATVAIGATAMTSRFVGARDLPMAVRVTHQALLAGAAMAVVATLLTALLGNSFVAAMQLEGDAGRHAARYLWLLTPVIPAIMIEQVGIACLRGAGDTVSGFVAMTIVNLVNLLISFALVTGFAGAPQLGWDGLAIGTAVGHLVGATIVLGVLLWGRAGLRLSWSLLRPDAELIRRLLRVGAPGGLDMLTVLGCHLWFLAIINRLGTIDAAAHSLGIRIEALAYLPGSAFQVAAATLAGQYLGAGDHRRASRSVLMSCLVGGGLMVATGLLFFVAAEPLTRLFLGSKQPATAQLAAPLLQIVAFSMPSLAVSMILTGALRGAGDTRFPLLFTLIGFLAVRIPGAYLLAWEVVPIPLLGLELPGLGLGVTGAWYAMVADIVLRSVLVTIRFFQGGWRSIQV